MVNGFAIREPIAVCIVGEIFRNHPEFSCWKVQSRIQKSKYQTRTAQEGTLAPLRRSDRANLQCSLLPENLRRSLCRRRILNHGIHFQFDHVCPLSNVLGY